VCQVPSVRLKVSRFSTADNTNGLGSRLHEVYEPQLSLLNYRLLTYAGIQLMITVCAVEH
jgi:hypothetical protein